MQVKLKDCNVTEDLFHFTNIKNIDSILNNGLVPQTGPATKMVGDKPNVSVTQGFTGIIGIINSFIYMLYKNRKANEIPEEFKKYFKEIKDFNTDENVTREQACMAMKRKLEDEVFLRVRADKNDLEHIDVKPLSSYDIKIYERTIDPSKIDVLTDNDNKVMSAFDLTKKIYEVAKNIEVLRGEYGARDFLYMFEMKEQELNKAETTIKNNNGKDKKTDDGFER